jgi:hypothetical protein
MRLAGDRRVELRGRGLGISSERKGAPYEFILEVTPDEDLSRTAFGAARKYPLVSCAAGDTRVLRCDPASSQRPPFGLRHRRPTRNNVVLDSYREVESEPVPLDIARRVRVFRSRFVKGDHWPGGPKNVPLPDVLRIRSNSFTAVSALRNLRQLFERFDLFGIDPEDYFWLADLPLQAYYRSGISPGPGKDGQTVNGRVLPEGWPPDQVFPPTRSDRPALQVHLALANLSTRDRRPWDRMNTSQAEPLGFAADPRWIWHELAHVLMMAALGELEFRFAHSVGDALAAIVADPGSRLALHPDGRGYTFPWVFAPRRHDRCVLHGWGWSGTIGKGLRDLPDSQRLRRKGYWTEQILSTTLFLLYRSLGGDTTISATAPPRPDLAARTPASDYTVYLIMAGLQLLGDPRVVPSRRPEQFAMALSEADEVTVACPTNDGQGNIIQHVGGCATKVVRWAFEAQGMYPRVAGATHDGPGMPPLVDIFIPDRRPSALPWGATTVDYGPGSYVPVSLDWGEIDTGAVDAAAPRWLARDDAISRANGGVKVKVANRGQNPAVSVDVTLWLADWPLNQPPPLWDPMQWQSVHLNQSADIQPGEERTFGPFMIPAGARLLVLAQADCPADRSNLNPLLGLACRLGPTPLNQLVPGDNNLGLALIPP